jgi:hypothetical protein
LKFIDASYYQNFKRLYSIPPDVKNNIVLQKNNLKAVNEAISSIDRNLMQIRTLKEFMTNDETTCTIDDNGIRLGGDVNYQLTFHIIPGPVVFYVVRIGGDESEYYANPEVANGVIALAQKKLGDAYPKE